MGKPDEPRDTGNSDGAPPPARRPYQTPEVVEYGSVAKLTQSGSMFGTDAMGMMACL